MAISLTQAAAAHIRSFMQNRPCAIGLRLGIKVNGCSGYAYEVALAEQINTDDQVFESHGVKVIVNTANLNLVDGTQIDFSAKGLNQGFDYHNPKVKSLCGCGESFGV